MTYSSNKEITDIHIGLVTRRLPKAEWTHAAHFAAAISMLADPASDPFSELSEIIRAYNRTTGVENTETSGYHHTITLASLFAARHILEAAPEHLELFEVTNRILGSAYGKSDWILNYWSKPTLFSPKARRNWVEPDIKSLPFSTADRPTPKTQ